MQSVAQCGLAAVNGCTGHLRGSMNIMFPAAARMRRPVAAVGAGGGAGRAVATVPWIKVDQFGYQPAMQKVAVVVDPGRLQSLAEAFARAPAAASTRSAAGPMMSCTPARCRPGRAAPRTRSPATVAGTTTSALTAAGSYYIIWDSARQVGSGQLRESARSMRRKLRYAVRMFITMPESREGRTLAWTHRWADVAAYERPGQDRSPPAAGPRAGQTARDLRRLDGCRRHQQVRPAQSAVLQPPMPPHEPGGVPRRLSVSPESGNGLPDRLTS